MEKIKNAFTENNLAIDLDCNIFSLQHIFNATMGTVFIVWDNFDWQSQSKQYYITRAERMP